MTEELEKEFVRRLKESLEYIQEIDDRGSLHFEMADWQEWIKTWPQILNEEGGI